MDDEPDTGNPQGQAPPRQGSQTPEAPRRKPPLRQRMRDVLGKLRPFPACD